MFNDKELNESIACDCEWPRKQPTVSNVARFIIPRWQHWRCMVQWVLRLSYRRTTIIIEAEDYAKEMQRRNNADTSKRTGDILGSSLVSQHVSILSFVRRSD